MARNPLTGLLKEVVAAAVKEDEQLAALMNERRSGRRKFLRDTVMAAGGMVLAPGFLRALPVGDGVMREGLVGEDGSSQAPGAPAGGMRVVIIGAGIAGLNACYQLKKQGIDATVYEASQRAGGRMYTMKDRFGAGITTDIGGEFVDTTHTDIRQLVSELGLELYDLREDPLTPKTYYFGGKQLRQQDLRTALAPFVSRLVADIHSLPEKISHATADSFRHLDEQSITEYLSGIGVRGWLFDFLNVTLTREYGMEASEQSAVNFLIMFEPPADGGGDYELFGNDHEVFKIKGGSQHLTDALYGRVREQVILGHRLVGIGEGVPPGGAGGVGDVPSGDVAWGPRGGDAGRVPGDDGGKGVSRGYSLSLECDGVTKRVEADMVLMTIPFTILRKIRFGVDMPAEKRKCIDEIGYGNSCKFVIGMDGKPWRHAGKQGYTFTDISFGCGWDGSQRQSDDKGVFTVFGGGDFANRVYTTNEQDLLKDFISGLEEIYPGSEKAYNGKNLKFCWSKNPFSEAAYSSFKKGQWSTLAGWEGVPVGNIYFAGEHVSRDFQGYMNGGAQTAREAVELMLTKTHLIRSDH